MTEPERERRPTRFSARPPPRFATGTDFSLWIKRVELYFQEAGLPEEKKGAELVSLLEDEPFRIVSQLGLVSETVEYGAVKACLARHFAPDGVELEWQAKMHVARQKAGESVLEFAGRLRVLADKGYPSWSPERRLEVARYQFIQGILSPTTQLKLLTDSPKTLDDAVKLAYRLQTAELAQEHLKAGATIEDTRGGGSSCAIGRSDGQVHKLSQQVERLTEQLTKLMAECEPGKRNGPKRKQTCWHCGETGHLRRDCPSRRQGVQRKPSNNKSVEHTSAVACTLTIQGHIEGFSVSMLVDTGSSVTLIHEAVWNKVKIKVKSSLSPCTVPVMAVNGEQLKVAGEIDLHLQIGTHQGKHKVLVVEQMLQQCLLGTDYLEKQKCLVDLGERTLTVGKPGNCVPLSFGAQSSTCHVVLGEKVVIPGYHQVRLPVRVTPTDGSAAVGIFEPHSEMVETHGVLIVRSISPIQSGQIVVQILNPLPFPATLQAEEAIGCFCCGAQVDVVSLEPVDTDTGVTCSAHKTHLSEDVARAIDSMVTRIDEISCADQEKLKVLLCEFSDVISVGEKDLGRTNVLKHKVNTGDAPPINQQARCMPYHQRETVKKMLDGMLQQDVIEASSGPWSSPIVLARKKDGTLRFCVDFRRVNDVTKKEVHPLPRIDETLDMLGGAKWFSTLDLASGYWQVEMEPEHKEKTAFSTPFGTYQFKVMPFGLSNAPSTFQKLMEMVLAGLHWTTCLVYLDDIVIFSTTVEQHLSRLRDVLARLKKAGLKLKPSKCHILKKCVHYLGHIVSADGVKVDDDKIKCVVEWPTPVNLEELRRFLGIASYYRKFIKGFAHIAAPLHALTEKLKPWEWTGLCEEAFVQLKTKLSSPPILSFPQFNMEFTVDCDASLEGLGAVLSQENDRCVVAYASRVLTKQERQYCATRREMLALVWAIQYFKPYLWGRPFRVRTDHSALKWLKNFKDPHGQVARWLEILSEYDFTVEHRPGLKHGNADALSRRPCKQCGTSQDQVENQCSLETALVQATESDLALWLPNLTPTDQETLQNNDPALAQVMVWVESNSFPKSFPKDGGYWLQTLWAQQKYLVLQNGVLYRRWEDIPGKGLNKCLQFVLPQDLVPTVLEQLHNAPSGSHLGVSKTVEKVRCRFYWPGQRRDIERWCAACETCATRKAPPTKPRAAMQADLPSGPFERVAMDILGPLPITTRGNKYILVVGDYFTKWLESFPLASIEAEKVAEVFVHQFVCRFGTPNILHTDQGRNFDSALVKAMCKLLGIKKTRTTAYHPQSDGLVERFNRTLLNLLSMAARDDTSNWDSYLPVLMFAYRTSVQESTGCTPFQLVFGREVRLPIDVMFGLPPHYPPMESNKYAVDLRLRLDRAYRQVREYMGLQQRRQKVHYDKLCNGKPFKIGDMVWLHCPGVPRGKSPKLHCYWQGPYIIHKVLSDILYQIQHRNNKCKSMVVHFNRLKPCVQLPPNLLSNQTDDLHVAGPGEEQLVVEDKGDIDGDIPAEASETDDEINSNIDREIPVEISETDDEMEAEELPVDQGDHLQGAEDVTPDEDVQMPEDVPANLRRSTRHSQRPDRWGHNVYDL